MALQLESSLHLNFSLGEWERKPRHWTWLITASKKRVDLAAWWCPKAVMFFSDVADSRGCLAKWRELSNCCSYSDSLTQMLRGRCGINNERTHRKLFIIKSSPTFSSRRKWPRSQTQMVRTCVFPKASPTWRTEQWLSEP